jgi:competence protein ComEA
LKKFIEYISLRTGLTKTEINTVIFVLVTFLIGLVAKNFKEKKNVKTEEKFNYSTYDSLFNTINLDYEKRLVSEKNNEKRVDSQAELSDFSTNKKDSKKNKSSQLELNSIDINTADESVLIELPGVGESIAKRIIMLRKQRGRFNKLNELVDVKGIGSKKFDKIKEYLYIEK